MITTTRHGALPEGVRDHHGVFGEAAETSPQARLLTAQARVAELKQQHTEARRTFHAACHDEDDSRDLQALKSNVSRLARELAEAEEELAQWESVVEQSTKADSSRQFDEKVKQGREARLKFAEHFRGACVELGNWYALGSEINQLANSLADRLPNGTVYYVPELKNVLEEFAEDPNPLPTLQDAGYGELQTFVSWRRHLVVVPLSKSEE